MLQKTVKNTVRFVLNIVLLFVVRLVFSSIITIRNCSSRLLSCSYLSVSMLIYSDDSLRKTSLSCQLFLLSMCLLQTSMTYRLSSTGQKSNSILKCWKRSPSVRRYCTLGYDSRWLGLNLKFGSLYRFVCMPSHSVLNCNIPSTVASDPIVSNSVAELTFLHAPATGGKYLPWHSKNNPRACLASVLVYNKRAVAVHCVIRLVLWVVKNN